MSLHPEVPIGDVTLVGTTYKNVIAKFGRYGDGNLAIVLESPDEPGERLAVATVNVGVPGVFIKTYSENAGLLEQLEEKGLVKSVGSFVKSGYVEIPEVTLQGDFAAAVSPWTAPKPATREDVHDAVTQLLAENRAEREELINKLIADRADGVEQMSHEDKIRHYGAHYGMSEAEIEQAQQRLRRADAKEVNLATNYGIGSAKLSDALKEEADGDV